MAYGNSGGGYNRYPRNSQGSGAPRNSAPRTQNRDPQEQNSGPTLYNDRAGKFLNFNYWGRYANIEIGAVPPGSGMGWDARKNAQKVTQILSFENLNEIWDICEEVMESIKNTGTFTSAGVRAGSKQDAIVEINNGSTINMAPGIYLVIYKNLDSGNRTNNLEVYPFGDAKIIRGYDHTSGMAKEDSIRIGQFKKFYRMVKEAAKAFTMAQAHSIQTIKHGDKLSTFKALAAITSALGIDMSAELNRTLSSGSRSGNNGGNNGGGGYSRNNSWGGNAPRNAGSGSAFERGGDSAEYGKAVMAALDDPVDINLSMDSLTNVDMSQFK